MKHYAILTSSLTKQVIRDLKRAKPHSTEIHLNRTRFYLDQHNSLHQWFYLKHEGRLVCIDGETDHSLGR